MHMTKYGNSPYRTGATRCRSEAVVRYTNARGSVERAIPERRFPGGGNECLDLAVVLERVDELLNVFFFDLDRRDTALRDVQLQVIERRVALVLYELIALARDHLHELAVKVEIRIVPDVANVLTRGLEVVLDVVPLVLGRHGFEGLDQLLALQHFDRLQERGLWQAALGAQVFGPDPLALHLLDQSVHDQLLGGQSFQSARARSVSCAHRPGI